MPLLWYDTTCKIIQPSLQEENGNGDHKILSFPIPFDQIDPTYNPETRPVPDDWEYDDEE